MRYEPDMLSHHIGQRKILHPPSELEVEHDSFHCFLPSVLIYCGHLEVISLFFSISTDDGIVEHSSHDMMDIVRLGTLFHGFECKCRSLRLFVAHIEIWFHMSCVLPLTKSPGHLITSKIEAILSSERLACISGEYVPWSSTSFSAIFCLNISLRNNPLICLLMVRCGDLLADLLDRLNLISLPFIISSSRRLLILIIFMVITLPMIMELLSISVTVVPMWWLPRICGSCHHWHSFCKSYAIGAKTQYPWQH